MCSADGVSNAHFHSAHQKHRRRRTQPRRLFHRATPNATASPFPLCDAERNRVAIRIPGVLYPAYLGAAYHCAFFMPAARGFIMNDYKKRAEYRAKMAQSRAEIEDVFCIFAFGVMGLVLAFLIMVPE